MTGRLPLPPPRLLLHTLWGNYLCKRLRNQNARSCFMQPPLSLLSHVCKCWNFPTKTIKPWCHKFVLPFAISNLMRRMGCSPLLWHLHLSINLKNLTSVGRSIKFPNLKSLRFPRSKHSFCWRWSELIGSLKFGNVLVFVHLIHRPMRTKNQLYKNLNIAQIETSYKLWCWWHVVYTYNLSHSLQSAPVLERK